MNESPLFPLANDAEWLLRYSNLPLHTGTGRVACHGSPDNPLTRIFGKSDQPANPESAQPEFAASFFVPVAGGCRVFIRWSNECQLSQDFGEGLTVTGLSPDGVFRLTCPRYYVNATSDSQECPGWAIAQPINEMATVSYGDSRPIARVTAIINNIDFDYGNAPGSGADGQSKRLRVVAAGKTVDFVWRMERGKLRRLVDAGLLGTASFVSFSFSAWPGASDRELTAFAQNVSTLCSYVVAQHTGIPILSFYDAEGRVVRRILREPVLSEYRDICALRVPHADNGLPRLFRQCFEEHCRMQISNLWQQLPFTYASIEDSPYLEQKFASLLGVR